MYSNNEFIGWFREGYYIRINARIYDSQIAKFLDLDLNKYRSILAKHGAILVNNQDSYFNTRISCEEALKELEPYIIMTKLK